MFRNSARGDESPTFAWEPHLLPWKLESNRPIGRGAFGKVYACRRGAVRAACKLIEVGNEDAARDEIECQRLCERFAPRVLHTYISKTCALIVMERFAMSFDHMLEDLFQHLATDVFERTLASLLPRLLVHIDGFRAPMPGFDIVHGDLSPRNVLLGADCITMDDLRRQAPDVPLGRVVACDFGYSTVYVSGIAHRPLMARSELRRMLLYTPGYDRHFFLASVIGAVAHWSKKPARHWVRRLGELAPARDGMRPSLKEELRATKKFVREYSSVHKWQGHEIWAQDFLDIRGINNPETGQKHNASPMVR